MVDTFTNVHKKSVDEFCFLHDRLTKRRCCTVGASGRIRTDNLSLKRGLLCAIELRTRKVTNDLVVVAGIDAAIHALSTFA
jgi:hypothetical protein